MSEWSLDDATDVAGRQRLQKGSAIIGRGKEGAWMDQERKNLQAYEYLCHVGEAKEWIEACTKQKIASIETLEEDLRNGIVLARLAKFFSPNSVGKIYEDATKLSLRHSDNINFLLTAMRAKGLPEVFIFETLDLYEKKNIPKVIYCIHALSHLLAKLGLAPHIKNLIGKLQFTDEQLDATAKSLDEAGVVMPQFSGIANALAKELPLDPRQEFLEANVSKIVLCQAIVRRHLAQKRYNADRQNITKCQAQVRMRLARKKHVALLKYWKGNEKAVVLAQTHWRGVVTKRAFNDKNARFKANEHLFVKVQAKWRGILARREFNKRRQFYKDHLQAIIKIQSKWKARHMEKAYKAISSLSNPPVSILQEFLHLLDDSDNDFEEELELERLRQLVVKRIRENMQNDTEVSGLDIKISLLVKNRISLEEVVQTTTKKMKQSLNETNLDNKNPFNLKGKDKETRAKVEFYGQLFYLIQTEPNYLAKLLFAMNKKSGQNVTKLLENIILALYGYAQNTREEYLFLNLIKNCISIEIDDISSLSEFWKANPLFIKLLMFYTRGAKDRQFLRDLLQPLVKLVLNNSSLEMETDSSLIYKSLIKEEETQTGEKSKRAYDATAQQAGSDPEVQKIQSERIEKIKEITSQFLAAITESLPKMPYGLRCVGMFLKETLKKKFPGNDDEVTRIVGNLIYYRYLNPAIVAPEAFDVIEANISPIQRKNLAEVAKVIHLSSLNQPFPLESVNTGNINNFLSTSYKKLLQFFRDVSTNVLSPEDHFCIDGSLDLAAGQKISIYISPNEILQLHRNIIDNLDDITPNANDNIRQILNDLGTPPPADAIQQGSEINLVLVNRFRKSYEEGADVKLKLKLNETKRMILAIIRIQSGKNLLDILNLLVTPREEALYNELQIRELDRIQDRKNALEKRNEGGDANGSSGNLLGSSGNLLSGSPTKSEGCLTPVTPATSDATSVTFAQLKVKAKSNLEILEEGGAVKKSNNYQDMLNSIAKDMLNKHRRRSQRTREIQTLKTTLGVLDEKAKFLDDQIKSYHDYINACIAQLGNKKGKGKKAVLFTRQYYHMRELKKSGKVPKFGSFKWTADALYKKGVLISIDEYNPRQYKSITLTISSDEAGLFHIESSFLGITLPEKMELRLEDLLQSQYNGVQVITLFDMAKVNVNLMIFLLNKKFYV